MVFATGMKTLDVPGRPGETVTIRPLGWKALRDAETAMLVHAAKLMAQHGREYMDKQIADFGGRDAVLAAAKVHPEEHYDPAILVARSVLRWDPPRPAPTRETEPELTMWLAREIVLLSNPKLFEASR